MGLFIYLSAFLVSFLLSCPFFGVNADTCAREWLQYQGNCYGYFEAKKTWEEAEIECQSYHRGTHLASILTLAETLVVANHIMSYQTQPSNVWIGLHDIRHANFLHLLLSTALKLLAGLFIGILLFGHLGYFCLQNIDGRLIRFGTTLHFLQLSRSSLVLMLTLLASLFILLISAVLCVQWSFHRDHPWRVSVIRVMVVPKVLFQKNGKWRWSDESIYNYKAWMLGKPNLRTKEYCVELVRPIHGANVSKESSHQYEEAPIRDRKDFTKWNNTACHKLNAYICKHEL